MLRHFIIALVLVGNLLGSFHVHEDGHSHEDCQVCVIAHNLVGSDPVELKLVDEFIHPSSQVESLTTQLFTQFQVEDGLSRAPPSFS
jgi:hypothetical protein